MNRTRAAASDFVLPGRSSAETTLGARAAPATTPATSPMYWVSESQNPRRYPLASPISRAIAMTKSIRLMAVKVRDRGRWAVGPIRRAENWIMGPSGLSDRRVDSGLGIHEPGVPGGNHRRRRTRLVGPEGRSHQSPLRRGPV